VIASTAYIDVGIVALPVIAVLVLVVRKGP